MCRHSSGIIATVIIGALSVGNATALDEGVQYSIKTVGDVIHCTDAGGRQRSVDVEIDGAITIYQHPDLHNTSILIHFKASTDFASEENYVSGHGDFGIKIISVVQPTEIHLTAAQLSSSHFRLKPEKPSIQGHFVMVIPSVDIVGIATGRQVGGMYFAVERGQCSFDG